MFAKLLYYFTASEPSKDTTVGPKRFTAVEEVFCCWLLSIFKWLLTQYRIVMTVKK